MTEGMAKNDEILTLGRHFHIFSTGSCIVHSDRKGNSINMSTSRGTLCMLERKRFSTSSNVSITLDIIGQEKLKLVVASQVAITVVCNI